MTRSWVMVAAAALLAAAPVSARAAEPGGAGSGVAAYHGLAAGERAALRGIARDSWRFYDVDVDPATHLPLDNVTFAGGSATPTGYGRYTSAANVGVYLWAVVAADDLGLIDRAEARQRVRDTLTEVARLPRDHGFLYQWYDTSTGHVLHNPGDVDCATETAPAFDNCFFISNVDNGWYASGLVIARQAPPEPRGRAGSLLAAMDFGRFYDDRAETHCNVNPAVPGNQPTGQMFGGYYV